MTEEKLYELQQTSLKVREHIIRMSGNGGCFIGASLSCADLTVYLYKEFLNISKETLNDETRDYLFLSKGHDVPALYGTFVELGWLEKDRLNNHLKTNDFIYWHPNRNIPGIEFHSGSLGHNFSVAAGVALDCKLKNINNKIVVIVGDGELNEGSMWEGLLVANAYKLDNVLVIVDRNQFQANLSTEELIPLEPLDKKFEAFNCAVKKINGHNFDEMENVFNSFPFEKNKISVVIAETVRGKGLPSIEKRADRWFVNFKQEEIEQLIQELHGNAKANLTSETLMVR
ncbi:transketolase [Stygiobacter electus]|jgi:transketolase|uniref:1-deoxy-D-xylulose-5-phosphate synthase N-terminal domain-containing protein n=1 Tax=Stygiobacter electus TaxID=3032292 RepID=A0AAE3P1L4_9BACT|nr:1-deoxy-D-xylulose-5-phosphate synthase N-terminal domain-containing protein [Stygiobacter electus]MDF1612717.1 1-deoxy-D-xylulose-5-phosphate synthase N-terminal domain-containing protein [Stygiobacter electus]